MAMTGQKLATNMLVIPVIEKPAETVASANAAMRVATVMPLRGVCAAATVTGADGTSVTLGSATVGTTATSPQGRSETIQHVSNGGSFPQKQP